MGRPNEFTAEERALLSAQGYQSVEIWVIDRKSEAYLKEAARQAASAAEADARDGDIDDWVVGMRGDLWDDETS
jgi:hypothetical protein